MHAGRVLCHDLSRAGPGVRETVSRQNFFTKRAAWTTPRPDALDEGGAPCRRGDAMIDSGSNVLGVAAGDFGLPPHTAMRYERPASALSPFVSSYAVLASDPEWAGTVEWMLPGWAQIWIVMSETPVAVRIGNRLYPRLPTTVLYGVTSRAMPVTARGGVSVAIDLTPLGWARFIRQGAEAVRDRVEPLETLLPPAAVEQLAVAVAAVDDARDIQGVLDRFFVNHLPPANPDEPMVRQIMALLADATLADLASAAAAYGIDQRSVRRLCKRYFGFPPKILMMRTRFLRALVPLLEAEGELDHAIVPPGYHDRSHFIRDAKRFLGMTPRQFIAQKSPYAAAARRARRLVIGTPLPALDYVSAEERSGSLEQAGVKTAPERPPSRP